MPDHIDVMISSTARDLPDHRDRAKTAIHEMGMYASMMETLPPSGNDAITVSLKMVDDAEIYLGIFARRYGYIPESPRNPEKVSITEMEYRRAVERGENGENVERMIFIASDEHNFTGAQIEEGEGALKLYNFKERLKVENIVAFYDSPEDLEKKLYKALAKYRSKDKSTVEQLHRAYDIPKPPEAHIAHPYTLLNPKDLVGRQDELNLLTEWVKPRSRYADVRIMNIVAIGGMGKSALTWKWFQEIATQEMKPLAGRMWWSFYESNATFENFITDALAYCGKMPRDDVKKLPREEQENQLWRILNREPYLLVLDGLERILVAYARMDANRLRDDDYDRQTANYVRDAVGLPPGAEQSFTGEHRMRQSADPRADAFLRKLAQVNAARILVSTRLYPVTLQEINYAPRTGCGARFLRGLGDSDAVNLARASGMQGSAEALLATFRRFENYPLLIRALSKEVAGYRRAPGDFEKWSAANPDFGRVLKGLSQEDAKSHVLGYALRGLSEGEKRLLNTIAAFRMPASYDTLAAILVDDSVGTPFLASEPDDDDVTWTPDLAPEFDDDNDGADGKNAVPTKPFATLAELDAALTALEDRVGSPGTELEFAL